MRVGKFRPSGACVIVCAGNFVPPCYAAEAAALMVERGARTENLLHCFVQVKVGRSSGCRRLSVPGRIMFRRPIAD